MLIGPESDFESIQLNTVNWGRARAKSLGFLVMRP
jgi:hypothetical protein